MTELEPYLTPVEIAAALRVQVRTVRGWLRDPNHPLKGDSIPGVGWRITRQQLKNFLESGK